MRRTYRAEASAATGKRLAYIDNGTAVLRRRGVKAAVDRAQRSRKVLARPGTRFLSRNALSVYILHPPFVILGARLLWGVEWPALTKFVALWALSAVVTFALSEWVFRRIPVLKAIL